MGKVLLIGNDINNVTNAYSWQNLITGLVDKAGLGDDMDLENKPFPMLYEEIFLKSARALDTKERLLKEYIAHETAKMEVNALHGKILGLKAEHILTTNYDLLLERAALLPRRACSNRGLVKEAKYSLFRYHEANDRKIWHIHGSETHPSSIALGYEHYGGYLQQMRNYVTVGTKTTYKSLKLDPLGKRLKKGIEQHTSWIDSFFLDDIHIFGLNLDFVEMHLWWLLTYRSRLMLGTQLDIRNRIFYYYPAKYEKRSKHKLEMLKVNGIETIPIPLKGTYKMAYYNRVIKEIANA